MKVYELAKNLGVKSVFLMDKIRKEWKLPVKSHMESLSPDLVKKIEEKFSLDKGKVKKSASDSKATKSTVRKTVKKTAAKKVVSKKATSTVKKKEKEEEVPVEQPVKVKSRIIRRRKEDIPEETASVIEKAPEQTEETPKEEVKAAKSYKSIRSDLVSVRSTDPVENSWNQNLESSEAAKKPPKKPAPEKKVEVKFDAADFRKREVVFQPKKMRVFTGEVKKTQITKAKAHKRIIKIHGSIDIESLAQKLNVKQKVLKRKLKSEGIDVKENPDLDFDTVSLIVSDFDFVAQNAERSEKDLLKEIKQESNESKEDDKVSKPPVVTIMGHVDHGKTTLLDAIRKAKVAGGEAGGITQHIGAYSVPIGKKGNITFIDTPGHEAFTAMRARGAQVTDIVVIVVSATDSVMPQTIEACNHAKVAETPIIVAVNKMDAQGANLEKVKQEMSKYEVVSEDWGGDTSFIPISALKGDGIKELLEQIQLVAEVQELKCNPNNVAEGMVIEASVEKGRGPVATLIVQDGTLKTGQSILAGECIGRVRQMKRDQGEIVKEVKPGFPVEVSGFQSLPEVGDLFYVVENEQSARELIQMRQLKKKDTSSLEELSPEELLEEAYLKQNQNQELNVILKSDVSGSLEALKKSLESIKGENVSLKIVHSAIGGVTESDVLLASTVNGTILGFNVQATGKTKKIAQDKNVEIRSYSVIYNLLDDVKKLMLNLLVPESVDEDQGSAEVRQVFNVSKVGTIAGCYVTDGKIARNSFIRVVRDGRLIYQGKILNLKRFKEDSKEVNSGFECGISIENFNDIKPKDVLESYIKKEIKQTEL